MRRIQGYSWIYTERVDIISSQSWPKGVSKYPGFFNIVWLEMGVTGRGKKVGSGWRRRWETNAHPGWGQWGWWTYQCHRHFKKRQPGPLTKWAAAVWETSSLKRTHSLAVFQFYFPLQHNLLSNSEGEKIIIHNKKIHSKKSAINKVKIQMAKFLENLQFIPRQRVNNFTI